MNIQDILTELDKLFDGKDIQKIEPFLQQKMNQAKGEHDRQSLVTLLNESIGFFRDTSQYEKAISCCREVKDILKEMDMEDTIPYATTLINIANAYRAAGKVEESLKEYNRVFEIYGQQMEPEDFRYASLWNNLSLLYQEMGDFQRAVTSLERALEIVELYPEARIELATTHTNLALSLLKTDRWMEAQKHLELAFAIFEEDEQKDYHYSAALSAMGELCFKQGQYLPAADYTRKAMAELESYMGKTEAYWRLADNLKEIESQISTGNCQKENHIQNGMELARAFYEENKEELKKMAGDRWERVAVGLVGEGSECFGFDDEWSWDHDFGPGFCIWLTDEDYEEIGDRLTKYYEALPKSLKIPQEQQEDAEILRVIRRETPQASGRVGVMRISDFYQKLLGTSQIPFTEEQWNTIPEERLATATNGFVFSDPLGKFTEIRDYILSYYPEEVRCTRLAQELGLMAQTGQYNYKRMLSRGEYVTADMMLTSFIKHSMNAVYLLNKTYAPYEKWLHRGMQKLKILPEMREILNDLHKLMQNENNQLSVNGDNQISIAIENIARKIRNELARQKLVNIENEEENYLAFYAEKVFVNGKHESLVEQIVLLEWKAFDQVKNEGGRADCQDNWNTFHIMRKSQYLTWSMPMLTQYYRDFISANQKGWNLITEKYARMMESTAPEQYAELKTHLPEIPEQKRLIIEQIVEIQVGWMETFAKEYPHMASNARTIHTSEDSMYDTSYETYLRGELGTYSKEMLSLYGEFIVTIANEQKNLAQMIMEQTALLYGYTSLHQAEQALGGKNI